MSKYICKTKCFHNGRLWTRGESLSSTSPKEVVPKHFTKVGSKEAIEIKEESEVTPEQIRASAAKAVASVGHKIGRTIEFGPIKTKNVNETAGTVDDLLT